MYQKMKTKQTTRTLEVIGGHSTERFDEHYELEIKQAIQIKESYLKS